MKRVPESHEPTIERALRERLERVNEYLQSNTSSQATDRYTESTVSNEDEETLRRFMVRTIKSVSADAPADDIETFFDQLDSLFEPAHDDLRYFDAYNNAFETIVAERAAELKRPQGQRFLEQYRQLLTAYIEQYEK